MKDYNCPDCERFTCDGCNRTDSDGWHDFSKPLNRDITKEREDKDFGDGEE